MTKKTTKSPQKTFTNKFLDLIFSNKKIINDLKDSIKNKSKVNINNI